MMKYCLSDTMLCLHNDVAPTGCNDVMFANKHERSDIIHEEAIISETKSFAEGKHHSKNPNALR
jgi:hypothetical protein